MELNSLHNIVGTLNDDYMQYTVHPLTVMLSAGIRDLLCALEHISL